MQTARRRLVVAGLLAVVCAFPASASADGLAEDLAARRSRVMERLGPDAMLVMWSAPPRTYSLDIDYPYRQDSNLYYLTGIAQAETALVLMPGNATRKEILFVADEDPVTEHWAGDILSHDEAAERSGISTVLSIAAFDRFISAMLNRARYGPIDRKESAMFSAAVADGRAKVALLLERHDMNAAPSRELEFASKVRDGYVGIAVTNALDILTDLRMVKTPYEQRLLDRSLEIAGEALRAGMLVARPGAYEYEVKAAVEAAHVAEGAFGWSFPSIVGTGPNTTVLHYPHSQRRIRDGDLVLVDAAANYEYLAGDLTRTYPASGRFTPEQREIYELVLAAQEAGIRAAVPGATLMDVHQAAVDVIREGLLKLGLITDATGEQYRLWFTHGSVHYIGIDVHDVGDLDRPLEPGMAFVIEPGIYVRQAAIESLSRTEGGVKTTEAIQPAVTRYLDMGIRIEDAFILEPGGLRRLTSDVPRTVDEIEAFLQ
ncbi:MAG: aminopeptidase P N-terminal domain-containing protein [Vicinamibacterales bacterium]